MVTKIMQGYRYISITVQNVRPFSAVIFEGCIVTSGENIYDSRSYDKKPKYIGKQKNQLWVINIIITQYVSMFYVTEKIVKVVVQRKLLHSSNSVPNMNCRKSMDCICNEDRIQKLRMWWINI